LSFAKPASPRIFKKARISPRNSPAFDFIQLLGLADEHDFGAEFFQTLLVGVKIALDG